MLILLFILCLLLLLYHIYIIFASYFKNNNKKNNKMKNNETLKKYTCQFIDHNYLIKIYGRDSQGKRINKLYGVSGTIKLIGAELLEKFIDRAERDAQDVCVCKLRRGLQVSLYVH